MADSPCAPGMEGARRELCQVRAYDSGLSLLVPKGLCVEGLALGHYWGIMDPCGGGGYGEEVAGGRRLCHQDMH